MSIAEEIKKNGRRTLKKSHLAFLGIFLVSTIGLRAWQYRLPETIVNLKGEKLHVLVADTVARQNLGLGKRDSLASYDGMLFIFPESERYGFVMRDMRFPIDIVWLQAGAVVDIAPDVPIEPGVAEETLRVYFPRAPANTVLELHAGWVRARELKIGDKFTGRKLGASQM